jgi:hypothetical protein
MKLSEADAKLVRRLGKNEKTWRWARWTALLGGLLMIGASAFLFQRLWSTLTPDKLLLLLCLFVAPVCGVVLFLGAVSVGYTLAFWKGRPVLKLLLHLIEECRTARD